MQPPNLPAAGDFRFRCRLWTRWSDEDNQQVLNNAVYLTLLEEARLRYFTELGLMQANQFPFVLAQSNLRFERPGVGGREVDVSVRTVKLGTSSFVQASRIDAVASGAANGSHGADSETWCSAEALLVAWDSSARAKRPMTTEFKTAIARFEGLDCE